MANTTHTPALFPTHIETGEQAAEYVAQRTQHHSRPNKNARRRANKHYARVRKDLSTCTCALYGYETCPTCS